jgi:hypothetical protein
MFITKEILNVLRSCKTLTFVKRKNGITYLKCTDIYIDSLNAMIDKEYIIDAISKCNKFYLTKDIDVHGHIKTLISFLKVNDEISIKVFGQHNSPLTEYHMLVKRPDKRKEKHYDYLLDIFYGEC